MSGTALYRTLVAAGAPEDTAKEAADGIEGKFTKTDDDITALKVMVAEIRVTNRLIVALVIAHFLLTLKLVLS